jgi:hypothetical protein
MLSTNALAAPVTLAWDAVSDSDLAGYKLYYGFSSRQYSVNMNVGNYTMAKLSGLKDA